jgi:hypothetical protein
VEILIEKKQYAVWAYASTYTTASTVSLRGAGRNLPGAYLVHVRSTGPVWSLEYNNIMRSHVPSAVLMGVSPVANTQPDFDCAKTLFDSYNYHS